MLYVLRNQLFGKNLNDRRNKLIFLTGLLIKLFIIYLFSNQYEAAPLSFIREFILNPNIDPWFTWFNNGNNINSFPYGPPLFIFILPFIYFGDFFNISTSISYGFSFLFADIIIYKIISGFLNNVNKKSKP